MPIKTVMCPECAQSTTVDLPLGFDATITHRDLVDIVRVRPRIQPMSRLFRPTQPSGEALRQILGRDE